MQGLFVYSVIPNNDESEEFADSVRDIIKRKFSNILIDKDEYIHARTHKMHSTLFILKIYYKVRNKYILDIIENVLKGLVNKVAEDYDFTDINITIHYLLSLNNDVKKGSVNF